MYRVITDALAKPQVDALPARALAAYAEVRALLEINPWASDPINKKNQEAAVRTLTFGPHHEGMVTFLILAEQRRVDVLGVVWLG